MLHKTEESLKNSFNSLYKGRATVSLLKADVSKIGHHLSCLLVLLRNVAQFLPFSKNKPAPFPYWEHRTVSSQFRRSYKNLWEKQCPSVVDSTETSTTCPGIFNKLLGSLSPRSCFRRTGLPAFWLVVMAGEAVAHAVGRGRRTYPTMLRTALHREVTPIIQSSFKCPAKHWCWGKSVCYYSSPEPNSILYVNPKHGFCVHCT